MADSNVNQNLLSTSQIGILLKDIAITARSMEQCVELIQQSIDDQDNVSALGVALETMSQRIGLFAEKALLGTGCNGVYGVTPEDWMMPPAYASDL
jgi:hypothetical protein